MGKPKMKEETVPMEAVPSPKKESVNITAPRMRTISIPLESKSPFVSNRFGPDAQDQMRAAQEGGSVNRKGTKRDPKDFTRGYKDSLYTFEDGTHGLNAAALRKAAISACRLVGFKMTYAKLSIFIEADGFDVHDGTPLVRLVGDHEMYIAPVRNASGGADLRARAMFREWKATVRVRFDADQFTVDDVVNLFMRVGLQVGIGAGRADSRDSAGLGFGFFALGSKILIEGQAA